ncbi:hypothetical protein ABK040_002997 [Willaertia magna]
MQGNNSSPFVNGKDSENNELSSNRQQQEQPTNVGNNNNNNTNNNDINILTSTPILTPNRTSTNPFVRTESLPIFNINNNNNDINLRISASNSLLFRMNNNDDHFLPINQEDELSIYPATMNHGTNNNNHSGIPHHRIHNNNNNNGNNITSSSSSASHSPNDEEEDDDCLPTNNMNETFSSSSTTTTPIIIPSPHQNAQILETRVVPLQNVSIATLPASFLLNQPPTTTNISSSSAPIIQQQQSMNGDNTKDDDDDTDNNNEDDFIDLENPNKQPHPMELMNVVNSSYENLKSNSTNETNNSSSDLNQRLETDGSFSRSSSFDDLASIGSTGCESQSSLALDKLSKELSSEQKKIAKQEFSKAPIFIEPKPVPMLPSTKIKVRHWIYHKSKMKRKKEAKEGHHHKHHQNEGFIESLRKGTMWCLTGHVEDGKRYSVPYKDLTREEKNKVHALLLDLGYALTIYGLSSSRVEYHLTLVSTYFGMDGYFFVIPTGIWYSFGYKPRDPNNLCYFVKIESQTIDCDKLIKLDSIAHDISDGKLKINEAQEKLAKVISDPPIYSHPIFSIFNMFIFCGFYVMLWNGTVGEVLTCFLGGLIIASFTILFSKIANLSSIIVVLAAILGGICGIILKYILWDVSFISVVLICLCTSFYYLPGYQIMLAIAEIQARSLVSGTSRLVLAFSTVLKLGFGLLITNGIVSLFPSFAESEAAGTERTELILPLRIVAVLIIAIGLGVDAKVPKYVFTYIYLSVVTLFVHLSAYYISNSFGTEVGTVVGAMVTGIGSNMYSLITGHPPIVVNCVTTLLLVPGSLSWRGFSAFLNKDSQTGISFMIEVFIIGMSIFFGLTVANVIVPIRQRINL